ncbi:MAG TPA: cytochrome c3 family protein [Pyrinomonadaceae bacterium]|nr:cytochrome c3 family protein [Pyrinomonadaceae bacterium]
MTETWIPRRILIVYLSVLFCSVSIAAQRRPTPRRTQTRPPAIDYSKFSHATKKHQAECNTCHKIPSEGWQKTASHPDITDYPDHAACVSCHRPQFFRTDRPAICSVCHTKVSPRDDARFPFRNPANSLQFSIIFPHDKHQDVIARMQPPSRLKSFTFRRTAFNHFVDDKGAVYNNCTICHVQQTGGVKPPNTGWLDGFVPDTASFKTAPSSHAACFNCHWKSQQPIAGNCAGCHARAANSYVARNSPVRISLKFNHERGGEKKNHVAECTTCHINITKSATLRGLKPDVPITACTECHNKDGLRQDVSKELAAIDKNPAFVCVYCHTSDVGRRDPPPRHYLIAERPAITRKDIK